MSTPAQLVAKVRRIEASRDRCRHEHAVQRDEVVRELKALVGASEAGRLLGITRSAVYKAL